MPLEDFFFFNIIYYYSFEEGKKLLNITNVI